MPTNKVATSGAAGALTVVAVWIAGLYHLEVPPEVAAAATVLISFAAGWLRRDKPVESKEADSGVTGS